MVLPRDFFCLTDAICLHSLSSELSLVGDKSLLTRVLEMCELSSRAELDGSGLELGGKQGLPQWILVYKVNGGY